MPRATFHPLAERELIDAARYYELESQGLGATFLDAAEQCERAIIEHPSAGAIVSGKIRRRLLRVFPYALLYRVESGGVRILAVMNLKRRQRWTPKVGQFGGAAKVVSVSFVHAAVWSFPETGWSPAL